MASKRFCDICNKEIPWVEKYYHLRIVSMEHGDEHFTDTDQEICENCKNRITSVQLNQEEKK